jgi:hypothetical protein
MAYVNHVDFIPILALRGANQVNLAQQACMLVPQYTAVLNHDLRPIGTSP